MSSIEISVLMPVHNAAATLRETLESLRRQTFKRFELVVVDDGSTDETLKILADTWPAASRLVLLRPGRVGLVEALQRGLAACEGKWVARMDADDVLEPQRLQAQWELVQADSTLKVVSSRIHSFKDSPNEPLGEGYARYDGWINGLLHHEAIMRERFIESPLPHPSVMFCRESIAALGGYQERGWPEDYDLWLRCAEAGLRFGKVDEVLLHWRDLEGRTSRIDPRYSQREFLRCKAHYLSMGPLRTDKRAVIWGAGPIGKKLGRYLEACGVKVVAYIDIDPRKIGSHRRGVSVVSPAELPNFEGEHLLSAVGARGARDIIRGELRDTSWREGENFFCVA